MQRNVKELNRIGTAYHEQKKYVEAVKAFSAAVKADPRDPKSYINRGVSYHHAGKHQLAVEDYNKVLNLLSNLQVVYNQHNVSIYHPIAHFAIASHHARKSRPVHPLLPTTYKYRGSANWTMKKYAEAITDFAKALSLKNNYWQAREALENLLSSLPRNADLSGIDKYSLFETIKKLSVDKQIFLLDQCLDKRTALGKRMWDERFFTACSLEKGILKDICDHLAKIDPDFVKPAVDSAGNLIDVGMFQRKRVGRAENDKPVSVLGMHNVL